MCIKCLSNISYLTCTNKKYYFLQAMISYNIITGDTLTKVFQRIPGGKMHLKNSEQGKFIG